MYFFNVSLCSDSVSRFVDFVSNLPDGDEDGKAGDGMGPELGPPELEGWVGSPGAVSEPPEAARAAKSAEVNELGGVGAEVPPVEP